MQRPVRRAGLLCSACMLLACTTLRHAPPMPPGGADEAYLLGRQRQLAHSSIDAVRLYRQALLADPQHAAARNGLAAALAEQGDFAAAIVLWQALIAQLANASDPGAAYLFSNLGHAYFLAGQYAAAQEAQERACLLEPANPHHWQRLASTLERTGDVPRALRMQRQALALLTHGLQRDAALAGASTATVTDARDDGWARMTLTAGADGLLTLQRSGAHTADVVAPATTSLEIANGNGVPGMARAIAARVRDPALRLVRLANAGGFGVRRTRIEYQPALRTVAARLAQQVQRDAVLVEVPGGARTGLRLVLGHNAVKPRAPV